MAEDIFAGDPRITPARQDLAALHLRGAVEADTYASGQPMRCSVPVAPLSSAPDADSEQVSQLLFGEDFTAYEVENGWAWGQTSIDGYVGYVPEADLSPDPKSTATHSVSALQALIYPEPDIKTRPFGAVPFGARLTVRQGGNDAFASLHPGGFIAKAAIRPISEHETLWVSAAEKFAGTPYLWGGRSPAGFDCSGLVQAALHAAGIECPRDSDMQASMLGKELKSRTLRRGDLVFWKGHVGVMLSSVLLLHANIHHMAVATEPLEAARKRISANGGGDITAIRRMI